MVTMSSARDGGGNQPNHMHAVTEKAVKNDRAKLISHNHQAKWAVS